MGGGYERMGSGPPDTGFGQGPSPYGAARNNYGGRPHTRTCTTVAALTISRG